MKIIRNTGNDRVIDLLQPQLTVGRHCDIVTSSVSVFAFAALLRELASLDQGRLVVPSAGTDLSLLGSAADRGSRNRLQVRWLAKQLAHWIEHKTEVRRAIGMVPQGAFVLRDAGAKPLQALLGSLALSTDGLGLTPGNPLNLIQASETQEEAESLSQWFDAQWSSLLTDPSVRVELLADVQSLAAHRDPFSVYAPILHHLFRGRGDDLDEDRIMKPATGIRNTVVWKKLYKFQRDGVVGAIDKLERFGGCIIADSVGLGKWDCHE